MPPRLAIVMNADGTMSGCDIISEVKTMHISDFDRWPNRLDVFILRMRLVIPKTLPAFRVYSAIVFDYCANKNITTSECGKIVKEMENLS